jgi:hypothetical protein
MAQKLIDLDTSIQGFFSDVVDDALRGRSQSTSEPVRFYLATLLADYGRGDALNREVLVTPLPILLSTAMDCSSSERFDRLRRLGDDVLYVAGFFGDHLMRRGVEVSFVSYLGAKAYDAAGALLRASHTDSACPDVFGELAERFGMLVAVLGDVAETLSARAARKPEDVLVLYGKWLENRSVRLADELARWGLVVPKWTGASN